MHSPAIPLFPAGVRPNQAGLQGVNAHVISCNRNFALQWRFDVRGDDHLIYAGRFGGKKTP